MHSFLFALLVAALTAVAQATSIGTHMAVTFPNFDEYPITAKDASAAGWMATGGCDAYLGTPYTMKGESPSKDHPLTLYFTQAGQLTGVGNTIFGSDVPDKLIDQGYWQTTGEKNTYFASVSFRAAHDVCSTSSFSEPLGTQLVLNQGALNFNIPTTQANAEAELWTEGACMDQMGYHYSYDIESAPEQSWEAANLAPITPMYWEGKLIAFFFSSADAQRYVGSSPWEVTLPNSFICYNWCEEDCTFSDNTWWSTMHFLLNDYNAVQCPCMESASDLACCD